MPTIQWYPGHIAKHERELKNVLKLVDVVVEVLDARMPLATINPRLEQTIRNKPVLVVLNKSDLADPTQTKGWLNHFRQGDGAAMAYETKTGGQKKALIQAIQQLAEKKMRQLEAKGMKRRPVRVLIVGMPNVGKSSLINSIVSRRKTQTGHKAGVTRQNQWVRIHPTIELLDTPGIIPPSLESEEAGALLATVDSVGQAAYEPEEVARFLLTQIEDHYPGLLQTHYDIPEDWPLSLESIAESKHYKLEGGAPDPLRAAQSLLSHFRQGRLGRLSLQHVC